MLSVRMQLVVRHCDRDGADKSAILLPICELMRSHPDLPLNKALARILQQIEHLISAPPTLLPPDMSSLAISSSSSPPSRISVSRSAHQSLRGVSAAAAASPPGNLLWAARCLAVLPQSLWDGKLSEEAMGAILSGIEAEDDAVRKAVSWLYPRDTRQ